MMCGRRDMDLISHVQQFSSLSNTQSQLSVAKVYSDFDKGYAPFPGSSFSYSCISAARRRSVLKLMVRMARLNSLNEKAVGYSPKWLPGEHSLSNFLRG